MYTYKPLFDRLFRISLASNSFEHHGHKGHYAPCQRIFSNSVKFCLLFSIVIYYSVIDLLTDLKLSRLFFNRYLLRTFFSLFLLISIYYLLVSNFFDTSPASSHPPCFPFPKQSCKGELIRKND
jgi:hypothetical protein